MTRDEAEKISAEFCAIHAYYMCLADHAERATRGECPAPLVPRLAELQVVDGWVVWGGRPVWSPADNALTSAQPLRSRWTPSMAKAAYIEAREQEIDATRIHFGHAAERVRSGNGSHESKAFRLAKIAFLESLLEQERRALRGEVAAPEVPDSSELELVDGWLMWKGRPVWWSGQRVTGDAASAADQPASAPAPLATPSLAAQTRPKRRRLLRLPWQRAAA
jgi:hypothetical protein